MSVHSAMLLSAGLGTRLRPLTEHTPKPLIQVGGRALIDYALERFADYGCERIVVNTHHHAEQLRAHLARFSGPSEIVLSHEETLLESGGGIVKALPELGSGPFFSANSDAFWLDEPGSSALRRLAARFDDARMDALLLLVPLDRAVGYSGRGDFDLDEDGQLRRTSSPRFVFSGLQLLHPRLFVGQRPVPFSLRDIYRAAESPAGALSRMFGLVHEGAWVHVGAPEELAAAERFLAHSPLGLPRGAGLK